MTLPADATACGEGHPADRAPIAIAVTIFSLFSIVCAVTSDGFLEADSCTHYLYLALCSDLSALSGERLGQAVLHGTVHRSRRYSGAARGAVHKPCAWADLWLHGVRHRAR